MRLSRLKIYRRTALFFVLVSLASFSLKLQDKGLDRGLRATETCSKTRKATRSSLSSLNGMSECGCVSRVTVVTAYFNIGPKSKHSTQSFLTWNDRFFKLADSMVIFTDAFTAPIIESVRSSSSGCTVIILEKIDETRLGAEINWQEQLKKDQESHHSEELYIIWNQKSLWLDDTANINPFQSTHFFWADSGQFRDGEFLDAYIAPGENWITEVNFIPRCNMTFLSIEEFESAELSKDSVLGRTRPIDSLLVRLGGGNFGGDRCAVKKWAELFLKELHFYVKQGAFAGKDQPIYGSACINHREICFLVDGRVVKESNDIWFAMQPVLHGVTKHVPRYLLD